MIQVRVCNPILKAALLGACLLLATFPAAAESSAEYLIEGQAYLQKGELRAAIIQLKNALKLDPKNAEARLMLGRAYLLRGDGAGAEKELERARSLGIGMDRLAGQLGRAYLVQGKADRALADIALSDDQRPETKAVILGVHANAYLMQKQPKKAEKAFSKALEFDPKSADALVGLSRLAAIRSQFDKASELADKALVLDPESSEAWAIKGGLARQKGDLALADRRFDQALTLQPLNPPALLGSAGVNLALGNKEKADKAIEQLLKLNPRHPLANYLHAVSLYSSGKADAAAEVLQEVLQVAPDHLPTLQMMGAIDFSKGRLEQAEQALSRVVSAMPENLAAAKLLATTQLQLGEAENAIQTLLKVEDHAGDDAQFQALLGSAYLRAGQNAKGIEYLESAAELDPQMVAVRTQLALGLLASGETSQAVKELETAIDLGKNVVQAELMLIIVHLRNRDFEQALRQAQTFARNNPGSPVPQNLAGAAYLGLAKKSEAREAFELALKKDDTFLPARMNLARLTEQEGRLDKAREIYRDVLKQQQSHFGALMSLARLAQQEGKDEQALEYLQQAWEGSDGAIAPGLALVRYYNQHQQPLRAVSIAREMANRYPDNPGVLNALGMSQMKNKDYHAALASFEALQRLRPDSSQSYYLLGMAREALEQPDKARDRYQKALSLAKDHLSAQVALARLEIRNGNVAAGLTIARTIQQQRPDAAIGYRLEGDILMQERKPVAAAEAYEKGLKKVESSRLLMGLYSARKKAGKTGERNPRELLEEWLKSRPDDLVVRAAYAGALQEAGELKGALAQYRMLLDKRPDDAVVLNNLAWTALQLDRSDAVEIAERAYRLAPDNPAIIDTLGWVLVETGKPEKGIVLLQRAVSLAPLVAEIRYHYGVALHRLGRDKEARSELSRALDMSKDFTGANDARILLETI